MKLYNSKCSQYFEARGELNFQKLTLFQHLQFLLFVQLSFTWVFSSYFVFANNLLKQNAPEMYKMVTKYKCILLSCNCNHQMESQTLLMLIYVLPLCASLLKHWFRTEIKTFWPREKNTNHSAICHLTKREIQRFNNVERKEL